MIVGYIIQNSLNFAMKSYKLKISGLLNQIMLIRLPVKISYFF